MIAAQVILPLSILFLKSMDRLESIRLKLEQFANERDWNQFHNPKNLAMALIAEAGELVEHFQWLSLSDAADLGDEEQPNQPRSGTTQCGLPDHLAWLSIAGL